MSKKILFPHGFPKRGEIYLVDFNRKREKEIFKISNLQNEYDRQILMAPISAEEDLTAEEIKLLSLLSVSIYPDQGTGLNRESKYYFTE